MRSIAGPAPIADFDGTLAVLPVPWGELRERLEVRRIGDLWGDTGARWSVVEEAEVAAAKVAEPIRSTHEVLMDGRAVAILTDNSENAVRAYLERFPGLEARVLAVVGRESLKGPKSDEDVFERGFAMCVDAIAGVLGGDQVTYLGDQSYELELADAHGARVLRVSEDGVLEPWRAMS